MKGIDTLVLGVFHDDFLLLMQKFSNESTLISNVHRDVGFALKWLRKLNFKYSKEASAIWYEDFFAYEDIKKIIIFDSAYSLDLVIKLRETYKSARLFFYFWNPVPSRNFLADVKSSFDQIFTFDKGDSVKFNLNFANQFFFPLDNDQTTLSYKAYFIGYDKGRFPVLKMLSNIFEKNSIKYCYQIKPNRSRKVPYKIPRKFLITKELSYLKVIDSSKKAEILIDILQKGQRGLTLRVMESLFLNKKLITNNKSLEHCEFYNSNNIYVIKNDIDEASLLDFIKKPYIKYDHNLIKKFLLESWLLQFS